MSIMTAILLETLGGTLREGARGIAQRQQQQQAPQRKTAGRKPSSGKPGCTPCQARARVEEARRAVQQYRR